MSVSIWWYDVTRANRLIYRESQLYELLLPNNQMSGVTIPISSVFCLHSSPQMTSCSSFSSSFCEHWTLFLAAQRLNKITQRDAIINQGFVCSSPLRNKNPLVSGSVQIIVCNPTLWHASQRPVCDIRMYPAPVTSVRYIFLYSGGGGAAWLGPLPAVGKTSSCCVENRRY